MASPDSEQQVMIDAILATIQVAREEAPAHVAEQLAQAFAIGLRAGSEIACLEMVERAIIGLPADEPLAKVFAGIRQRIDGAIKQVEQ